MSSDLILALVFVLLIGMLVFGVPVGFALLGAGVVGLILLDDVDTAASTVAGSGYSAVANFAMVVVPLFVVMGFFINHSGLGEQLFALARKTLGRLPGGLAIASIFAGAGFGAVTGASVTGVATIGPVAVPEMRRYGYSAELATGVVAAAGTLGILIPPSIAIVIYGITTEESIESLLLGGILPGILSAIVYSLLVVALVLFPRFGRIFGTTVTAVDRAPVTVGGGGTTDAAPATDAAPTRTPVLGPALKIGAIFAVIVGGIYLGLATAVEAAALGAVLALLVLVRGAYQRGGRTDLRRSFARSISESVTTTAMLFLLFIGGSVLGSFLLLTGAPRELAEWVTGLGLPPIAVVCAVLLGLMILGCFLDGTSIILVAVPLVHPIVVTELGYNPIWFCILVVKAVEIGLITPPVGLNVFVAAGITKTPVEKVFRGSGPFLIADLVTLALLLIFPTIVTFIPELS